MKVLVTGVTGYIGGRLVPRLLERGFEVRCMSRDPAQLTLDPWRDQVEVVAADALEPASLDNALEGCDAAYYLIHAMKGSPRSFAEQGRQAADRARLGRIVYLGALGTDDEELSEHLASRQEVGRILASGRTPVVELRAAVIIGSGSMSFEMIRHLTEVLPIIMKPKWVGTRCQPIAVRNVLDILVAMLDEPDPTDRIYDIGGPDILTYEEMMQVYAEVAGLARRVVIPLPIFSARLSPLLVGLATPLPLEVARPLIESLLNDVVVSRSPPPGFAPEDLIPYRESLQRALARISHSEVETRWSDALSAPAAPLPGDPVWSGAAMEVDRRIAVSKAPVDDANRGQFAEVLRQHWNPTEAAEFTDGLGEQAFSAGKVTPVVGDVAAYPVDLGEDLGLGEPRGAVFALVRESGGARGVAEPNGEERSVHQREGRLGMVPAPLGAVHRPDPPQPGPRDTQGATLRDERSPPERSRRRRNLDTRPPATDRAPHPTALPPNRNVPPPEPLAPPRPTPRTSTRRADRVRVVERTHPAPWRSHPRLRDVGSAPTRRAASRRDTATSWHRPSARRRPTPPREADRPIPPG